MPSYRVPIEDEVFRSMKVDNFSKTPYSDATQVSGSFIYILIYFSATVLSDEGMKEIEIFPCKWRKCSRFVMTSNENPKNAQETN